MYQGVRGGLKSKVECCSLEEGDSGPCSIKICEATGFIATNKGLTVDFFAVKVAGVWDMSWGGFTSHELQPITVESEISDTSMVMILGPLAIMAFLMFEVELIWISLANMQRVYITLLSYGLYIGNHKYGAFVQMIIFIITVGLGESAPQIRFLYPPCFVCSQANTVRAQPKCDAADSLVSHHTFSCSPCSPSSR